VSGRRLFAMAALLAGLLVPAPARAQAPSGETYDARWRAAAQALAAFATTASDTDDAAVAAAYRRERERFAAAVARLGQTPPPRDQLLRHWTLLPLHEQALAAMTVISAAADRRDRVGLAVGWASLRDTTRLMRAAAEELARGDE